MKAKTKKAYKITPFVAKNMEHTWNLKSPNGQILCGPEETFKSKKGMKNNQIKVAAGMLLSLDLEQITKVVTELVKHSGMSDEKASGFIQIFKDEQR